MKTRCASSPLLSSASCGSCQRGGAGRGRVLHLARHSVRSGRHCWRARRQSRGDRALAHKLGLDRPLLVQLFDYYRQLLKGDLGTSLFTTRPVSDDLLARLPATIELTIAAMIIAVVIGIPLGVVSATRRNTLLDHGLRIVTVAGLAVASFWLALMLQLVFAMDLGWLPLQARITGFPPPTDHWLL